MKENLFSRSYASPFSDAGLPSPGFTAVFTLMHMPAFVHIHLVYCPFQGWTGHAGMPAASVRIHVVFTGRTASAVWTLLVLSAAGIAGVFQLPFGNGDNSHFQV